MSAATHTIYTNCPACGYRKSLAVTRQDGKELYYCHAGCDQSSVISMLRGEPVTKFPRRSPAKANASRQEDARRLWKKSIVASGTVVETYLAARGLSGAVPSAIRFVPDHIHKQTGTRWPVMLAAVMDTHGRLQAIHRTYLSNDGSGKAPVEPAKMTLGPIGGYAVHLTKAGTTLALAEGIETAMSVMLSTGIAAWAAIAAGNISKLILPALPLAAEVIICADNDVSGCGQRAANAAAMRWLDEGRHVRIALPPNPGTDFNDVLTNQQTGEPRHAYA